MRVYIGIVTFNKSSFLKQQIERINKYLTKSDNDIISINIADNSTHEGERVAIKSICENEANYIDIRNELNNPSLHHSMTLNDLYKKSIEGDYDITLFYDHDAFLFNHSSIIKDTYNKYFSGIGQGRKGKLYMHPNSLAINNNIIDKSIVNLSPCDDMDTGGSMATYISNLRHEDINHLKFEYAEYSYNDQNDLYEIIDDSCMHFIKGSNWNENKRWRLREQELFNQLEKISV